ncbi:MAG: NUDIX domain-containing protein [Pseudomonadota bacterium]
MENTDDPSRLRYVAGVDQQAGALAWQDIDGVRRVWLVTSRRTRRWVLPKGNIDFGMTPPEAAAQEAYEEAGLKGTTSSSAIGLYRVPKIRPPLIWTVEVSLFAIQVSEVLAAWQEEHQRERRLVTIDEAAELIFEEEIADILRSALPRLDTLTYQ